MALLPNAQPCPRNKIPSAFVSAAFFAFLAQPSAAQSAAFIVGNDRGDVIRTRAQEVLQLKAENRRAEIRGSICLSSGPVAQIG